MSRDRLDELLERALRGDDLPADATASEREQVARLVRTRVSLASSRAPVADEADASTPTARARFARFIEAEQRNATPPQRTAGRSWWTRVPHRGMVLAASAVAIGVLAVGAAFAFQAVFSTTGDANAEVLTANDYAQVQGVVTGIKPAASTTTLTIQSAFGAVSVEVGANTDIERAGSPVAATKLAAGQFVTISGVAADGSNIAAQTVEVDATAAPRFEARAVKPLKPLAAALEGKVVAFAVSPDGEDARVLLEANGKSYVVRIEGGAVERLLARSASALGADVVVSNGANATDDIFSLTLGQAPPVTTATTSLMGVRGVVIARRGNLLEVATAGGGRYTVAVSASTRIVLAKSGLTRPQVRTGQAVVGHVVSVAGAVNQSTGRIAAELVVVGAKHTAASGQVPTTAQ